MTLNQAYSLAYHFVTLCSQVYVMVYHYIIFNPIGEHFRVHYLLRIHFNFNFVINRNSSSWLQPWWSVGVHNTLDECEKLFFILKM